MVDLNQLSVSALIHRLRHNSYLIGTLEFQMKSTTDLRIENDDIEDILLMRFNNRGRDIG